MITFSMTIIAMLRSRAEHSLKVPTWKSPHPSVTGYTLPEQKVLKFNLATKFNLTV